MAFPPRDKIVVVVVKVPGFTPYLGWRVLLIWLRKTKDNRATLLADVVKGRGLSRKASITKHIAN